MKRLAANCWISDDESWVKSYNTHVADIDHNERTVTARGYWSRTTARHIQNVACRFGYRVFKNGYYDWNARPKRTYSPKPSFKESSYVPNIACFQQSRSNNLFHSNLYYGNIDSLPHAWQAYITSLNGGANV